MTMLQYCCFTSILCLRHQEGQVGPNPQVVEIIFVCCLTIIRKTKRVFFDMISQQHYRDILSHLMQIQ